MIKRIFVTILVIGLTACHVGQLTTLYTDKTSYEQDGIRYDAQNLPITGVYHKYSKTMRLQEESHYVDGKLDGTCLIYNNSGKVVLNAQYKKGKLHGKTIS